MPRPVHLAQSLDREALKDDARLWALYERLFPACEREPPEVFERALDSGWGHVLRVSGALGTEGFAAFHLLRAPAAVFLVYLAVDPAQAGAGRGSCLFEASWELGSRILADRGLSPRAYVWEVEDPARAASENERHTRDARISFFEARGGQVLNAPYFQPGLGGGEAVPMRLMARGAGGRPFPAMETLALVRALYFEKYGAINGLSRESLEGLLEQLALAAPGRLG